MSNIKEFVSKLREKADIFAKSGCASDGIVKDYKEAADMIEELSEKLASAKTNSNGMKEFVEKLIERLEERKTHIMKDFVLVNIVMSSKQKALDRINELDGAIKIVNQLAEEYNPSKTSSLAEQIADDLSAVLKEAKSMGCKEVKYFHHIPLENVEIVIKALMAYNQDSTKKNQGWIPVTERLPEDCDHRFYMCIVENHEEDLPMFCQYEEDYGFGFWQDFYDKHTLGFLDSEFRTNEELGYEKVIAWQPLPEPYKPEQQKEIPTKHFMERFNRVV